MFLELGKVTLKIMRNRKYMALLIKNNFKFICLDLAKKINKKGSRKIK